MRTAPPPTPASPPPESATGMWTQDFFSVKGPMHVYCLKHFIGNWHTTQCLNKIKSINKLINEHNIKINKVKWKKDNNLQCYI